MEELLDSEKRKTIFLKYKYVLILFFISWSILSMGKLFKIQSWPFASEMLTIGTLLEVFSYILAILKCAFTFNTNSFLNK